MTMPVPEHIQQAAEALGQRGQMALALLQRLDMLQRLQDVYMQNAGAEAWGTFLKEVTELDVDLLEEHRYRLLHEKTTPLTLEEIEPIPLASAHSLAPPDNELGRNAFAQGNVAALVFAGGTATRFFTDRDLVPEAFGRLPEIMETDPPAADAPKGAYPITPVIGKSFVWRFAEEALAAAALVGKLPLLLFMTSPTTDEPLERHLDAVSKAIGYPRQALVGHVMQGMLPRLDELGCLISTDDGHLIKTGDGHGGVYRALLASQSDVLSWVEGLSLAERLNALGVEHVVMGNIDNAMLKPFDFGRVGAHIRSNAQFTSTLVARRDEQEKVGVPVRRKKDGATIMVEYSELPAEIATARDTSDNLMVDSGHISANVVALEAIDRQFPWCLYTGKMIATSQGNISSSSYEKLHHYLVNVLEPKDVTLLNLQRDAFFQPTKGVLGQDSLQETVAALLTRDARMLAAAGAEIPFDEQGKPLAAVEISILFARDTIELGARGAGSRWKLAAGSRLYLGVPYAAGNNVQSYSPGLTLEKGASLIVTTDAPLGDILWNPETGAITTNPESAGLAYIGDNVTIAKDVTVRVHLGRGETFSLSPGTTVTQDIIQG